MKRLTTMYVLAGALMLTSCSMVEEEEVPAEELYTRSFIKAFGVIDPKQDWNMATQVTANVNTSSLPSSTYRVRVYTANPINPDSRLMADYTLSKSSQSSFKFDALKGATEVFVTAEGSEGIAINGYYAVNNNTVSIGGETRAMTRADEEPLTGITVSDAIVNSKRVHDASYNLEEAKKIGDAEHWEQNATDWKWYNINGVEDNENNPKTTENTQSTSSYPKRLTTATFKTVTGAYKAVETTPWKLSDIISLVSPTSGKFKEGADNRETYKEVFEHDVIYLTNNEPIELTFRFGGTMYYNYFAYYYWDANAEDQETSRANAVRYIIMSDARPDKNVFTGDGTKEIGGGMAWPTAVKAYEDNPTEENNLNMYGTTYKLVYFDEKGNAYYNFPSGYKIAFDVISTRSSTWPQTTNYLENSNNSIRRDNFLHGLMYGTANGVSTTEGEISAVTYKAAGNVVMGFEDGTDHDMNDILFIVKGIDEEDDDIPVVIPDTKAQSWTIACEDLGSTDDYDFNDVVMNISYVSSNTDPKLTATPLAAGGVYKTEVYFGENKLGEIHNLIDKKGERNTGSYPMLNTTSKGTAGDEIDLKDYLTEEQKTNLSDGTFSLSYDEAKKTNMAGFSIKVYKSESDNATVAETITAPTTGEVPQMFLVDGSWAWPTERTDIRDAYETEGHAFKDWVKDSKSTDWWEHPSGSVVK